MGREAHHDEFLEACQTILIWLISSCNRIFDKPLQRLGGHVAFHEPNNAHQALLTFFVFIVNYHLTIALLGPRRDAHKGMRCVCHNRHTIQVLRKIACHPSGLVLSQDCQCLESRQYHAVPMSECMVFPRWPVQSEVFSLPFAIS